MPELNVLIIEDHHLIVNGYTDMLALLEDMVAVISVVSNCEEAYNVLTNRQYRKFDLVFLDWSLPPFERQKIFNGGDLVRCIKSHSINSKIIIITSHTDAFTLYQIIKDASPAALLCKADCRVESFPSVYDCLLKGEIFYSSTVNDQLKQITSRKDYLDNYNRQIITLLAKGVKTKNLPQYLPLSISSIDKRKAQIKDYFLINKGGDEEIINAARKEGFI
jgi:two-component system response regulator NreC